MSTHTFDMIVALRKIIEKYAGHKSDCLSGAKAYELECSEKLSQGVDYFELPKQECTCGLEKLLHKYALILL
jgi:hypothetical protein